MSTDEKPTGKKIVDAAFDRLLLQPMEQGFNFTNGVLKTLGVEDLPKFDEGPIHSKHPTRNLVISLVGATVGCGWAVFRSPFAMLTKIN